jgi:SAM-dependent methyltransferase
VLDAGCNRGGFLRLLADRCDIAEGFGYDPAAGAVEDARRLAGDRPLRFEEGGTVPPGWTDFDVAFSHEVLYVLHDLAAHAAAVHAALRRGGSYYAVMGVHADSPMMVEWHRANAAGLHLPKLYGLDEVATVFVDAGFDVGVSRLALRFVPGLATGSGPGAGDQPFHEHGAHHEPGRMFDWLRYYYDDKVMLRFTRPTHVS